MQATKPCRTTERPVKEFQNFCEWMVCVSVSELENWQCELPKLSNVDKIVSGLFEVGHGHQTTKFNSPSNFPAIQ